MDRTTLFNEIRKEFGPLSQDFVTNTEIIIDNAIEEEIDIYKLAYILATVYWETNRTMCPVREAYWKDEGWRKRNLRYYPYYGRGYVQLTWKSNYDRASQLIGEDMVNYPDKALEPDYAAKILIDGMKKGWYTGKSMDDYITTGTLKEYTNARRIINGTDKAAKIAKLAMKFRKFLDKATKVIPPKKENTLSRLLEILIKLLRK